MRGEYEDGGYYRHEEGPEPATFEIRERGLERDFTVTYHKVQGIRLGSVGLHSEMGELHVSFIGEGESRGLRLGRPFKALAPAYHFFLAAARHLNEFGHDPTDKQAELTAARNMVQERYYGDI